MERETRFKTRDLNLWKIELNVNTRYHKLSQTVKFYFFYSTFKVVTFIIMSQADIRNHWQQNKKCGALWHIL
jgi:hypothetical protein